MKIELITTGDEVLYGEIANTNAAWLSEQCRSPGLEISRHITVGDDHAAIGDACKEAATRSDVVAVSGGLGATIDDITLESVAEAFDVSMEFHADVWKGIEDFFRRVGRPCSENNKRQAYLPAGGVALSNKVGTAPGVRVVLGGATFFFLPGVPAEMRQIFTDHILPWLKAQSAGRHYFLHVLRCVGLPEALLDQMLRGVDLGGITLAFRATFPEVRIKLSCVSDERKKGEDLVTKTEAIVRERVGEYIYGTGEETLPGVVGSLLLRKGKTIAVAESCTGGYIANQITNVPGASGYFVRGVVAYSNDTKVALLGVPQETISNFGAVSAETARAMAEGVRCTGGACLGLAVTGIAGPTGGTKDKPAGTVYIALAHEGGTQMIHQCFQRDRLEFKMIVGATALDMVRRHLLKP